MLFFSIANLTSFIAPDYGTMLVSRFAAGLPHGAFFGVAAVIAASLVAPTKRGWAISMVMAGLTVSNVIGVPFGTWLGQTYGWRLLFLLVGVIGLLTLVMLWKFVPYQKPHADASFRRELGALKRLQVWLAILIGIVGFGGFFATYTYIAHTMTSVAGIPAAWLPLVVRALRAGYGGRQHRRRPDRGQVRDGHHLLGAARHRRGTRGLRRWPCTGHGPPTSWSSSSAVPAPCSSQRCRRGCWMPSRMPPRWLPRSTMPPSTSPTPWAPSSAAS